MEARLGRLQGRGSISRGSTLDRASQGHQGQVLKQMAPRLNCRSVPMKHTSCIWHHVKRRAVCSFVEKFNVKRASQKEAGIEEVSPTLSLHVVCRSVGWAASD
ncbi:uncharacterized protein N7496_001756 [Penicillium cataractarum]|uniref:Uncharacterized protein n=1 Tax=Penicillium cataractarum TaxID=2100454 RepID=A0A9W9VWR2_9EURO|nr:uncharacterized protein N7496_001756 [Penicillium cataractarum]KAJ5390688.1 hypothetical protein N7496_001756 [Penicillium cataractarum]